MNADDRWVILVTDPLAEDGLAVLEAEPRFEVRVRTEAEGDALFGEAATAHALLVRSGTQVTADLIAAAPRLRVIGRAGSGVDNIDVAAATRRGVVVMNTPGGNSIAAAEHTFALLLSLLRNVPAAARDLAAGTWNRKKYMGHQLAGKTLGLVGFGRIGREVGIRARAFGMEVITADPLVTEALAREWEARLVDLPTLLAEADVVSLHVPVTEETRNLINAKTLALMKPTSVLVNCARGALVDEAALLDALNRDALAGAALDVFQKEPPEGDLPRHPKVVCTPHLGASTEEAQITVAGEIAHQVRNYLLGGEIRNAVNMPSLTAEAYTQIKPFLDLGERLGALAGQIAGAPLRSVEVIFHGESSGLPRAPIVSAALVGVLRSVEGGSQTNYVNARLTAKGLGVPAQEKAVDESGDHAGLIEVSVRGGEGSCTVAGWVTAAGKPRLARWEGLGVDVPPSGDILVLRNPDVPGVVGAIGTMLGEAGVNIGHIAWGRDPEKGEAFTLINLDAPMSDALLETIRGHAKVFWARRVKLPELPG
jgi:D-3-phosphoglycerate dehydrogenase